MNRDNYLPKNDRELPCDIENGRSKLDSPPINAPFMKNVQLNIQIDNEELINFFKQFLDHEFMQLLVTQTNLYAQQCTQGTNLKNNSRLAQWKLVDHHEMKVFLSLVICIGLVEKKGPFRSLLSQERYSQKLMSYWYISILRCLHPWLFKCSKATEVLHTAISYCDENLKSKNFIIIILWDVMRILIHTWTASSEFGTYRLCKQRKFRRACASAQSRQNLRCSLIQAVSQEEPSDRKPDPWPLWMAGHAQLKFVMTECSKTQICLTGLTWYRTPLISRLWYNLLRD